MKTFFLTLTLGVLIFPKSLLLAQVVPIQSAIDEVEACIKEFCSLYSINKDFYVVENKDCEISICVYAGRKLLCPQSEKVPLYIKKDPYGKFNKYEVFHKAFQNTKGETVILEDQSQGLYTFEGLSLMCLNTKNEMCHFVGFERAAAEAVAVYHSNLSGNEFGISLTTSFLLSKIYASGDTILVKNLVDFQRNSDVYGFVAMWFDKPKEKLSQGDVKHLIKMFEVLK